MKVRSCSWGDTTISWSTVIEELLHAAEELGHDTYFESTNGYNGLKYKTKEDYAQGALDLRTIVKARTPFDIDLTYTFPPNFGKRFLPNSKRKMAMYAYESSIMPKSWTPFYRIVDHMLPHSKFCADMMIKNGCPEDKVTVVNLGINEADFHPDVPPFKISTEKGFKFLCIGEPHHRKQIDKLLDLYCRTFSSEDDVCFVLKTKLFLDSESKKKMTIFEMDLTDVLVKLRRKYGSRMPEIKVIGTRIPDIASLYTACDAFVLMSVGEGWCMPYLEAQACGLTVIAPRHGGPLDFLNDGNAILTKCGEKLAKITEQYFSPSAGAMVGDPDENEYGAAMRSVFHERQKYKKITEQGVKDARKMTWKKAFLEIERLCK